MRGSFFWAQLLNIKSIFHWCTEWVVADGNLISFWYDNWRGTPLRSYRDGRDRPPQPYISLADAIPIMDELLPFSTRPNITIGTDVLTWRWDKMRTYTAKSAYDILIGGGKIESKFSKLWSAKCPTTVKVFLYLMLNGKILTQDVMRKRHIQCGMGCVMCNNCPMESALHLLFLCPYAVHVWWLLAGKLGYQIMQHNLSIQQIWTSSWEGVRASHRFDENTWMSWFACTTWLIWKQRNVRIFRGKSVPPNILAEQIAQECELWLKNC